MEDAELTNRVNSCPQFTAHRMTVLLCLRTFARKKRWECIGGKSSCAEETLGSNKCSYYRTWVLTTEDVLEPPVVLAEERKKAGIAEDDFVVCDIGETRVY